jgi:predicted NBD/HSP70 family sugar kinase
VARRIGPVEGTPAEAAVFTTVLTGGSVAQAEIAERTGLSSAAVTRAVKPLLDAGYLEYDEAGPAAELDAGRLGRPRRPLRVRALRTGVVGVKITGDELIGVVCDLAGSLRATRHRRLPDTTSDITPGTVIAAVATLYRDLLEAVADLGFALLPRQLGVSLSGDVNHRTGFVRYSPFLRWRDVDLGGQLARDLGVPPIVENDVKALTVAEQWFGLSRGVGSFAVVTVGAGIGSALVVDGSLVRGAHSVAGEIGHLPLGDRKVRCHCGAHGCLEAHASTDALVAAARDATGRPDLSYPEAVDLARRGDDGVAKVFAQGGVLIGRALASVANLLGPQRIIVSGEGVVTYDLFADSIRQAFSEHAFGAAHQVALHVQDLPFEEWARGAAAVAIEALAFPSRTQTTPMRRVAGGHARPAGSDR